MLWLTGIFPVVQFKGDHLQIKRCYRTSPGGADGSDSLDGILVIFLSDKRYRENPSSLNKKEFQKYEDKVLSIFLYLNSGKHYLIKKGFFSEKGDGSALYLFPYKFTMKCQNKISLFQEVKFTGHLEEKIKNDNVKLTDKFDSNISNDCEIFTCLMLLNHQRSLFSFLNHISLSDGC